MKGARRNKNKLFVNMLGRWYLFFINESYLMPDEVVNFDPNVNYSGRMATKVVRLTFGLWEYRWVTEATVGGNTPGLSVIEAAVGSTFEKVADSGFTMVRERDGAELLCENIEERDEDWLEEMLVSAEITSVAPAKPLG